MKTVLQGPISIFNPIVYDTIDESRVLKKAAQITKGGSEPSGLDAGVVRDSV